MAFPPPLTHFVKADHVNKGRKSIAICGDWTDESDIAVGTEPTCEYCLEELAKYATETVESVFGAPTVGTQVHTTLGNPLAGYRPKGARS